MQIIHGLPMNKKVDKMQTLVIYDTTGEIFFKVQGRVQEPSGSQFLWLEIPAGKILKSIATTKTPHEPVYHDIMGIDTDTCTLEQLKAYMTAKSKDNLESYLAAHPIISKCHGGVEKQYTITKEKQALLTQMIMIAQVAVNAGQTYQPSWNAQGEPCTYDWTLQELQQLAFETEAVVRPLVIHQQTMETEINAAKTKENALAVK